MKTMVNTELSLKFSSFDIPTTLVNILYFKKITCQSSYTHHITCHVTLVNERPYI